MSFWETIFGKRQPKDAVAKRLEAAVEEHRKAAANLESTVRDLLDENDRLRKTGENLPPSAVY